MYFQQCAIKLYNWLKVGPYQIEMAHDADEGHSSRDGVRVLGIAYSDERLLNCVI